MKTLRRKLAFQTFNIGRKVARATGLIKPLRRTIGPIIGRVVARVSADHEQPVVVNGHHMILGANGNFPPISMATGRYEIETTRLFERLLRPGMVVVDVGAHVGYYSLVAARQVGSAGWVHAFEPEPANYALLLRNIELNGYKNIGAVEKALSHRTGEATLFLTGLDSGRHSTYDQDLPSKGTLKVQTTTADAFLADQGWPKVDLIKIDVEGAEMDVLHGMDQLLERSGQLELIVEFNPALLQGAAVSPLDFLEELSSLGFKINYIDREKGPLPLQEIGSTSLVEKLVSNDGSLNLYCTKK